MRVVGIDPGVTGAGVLLVIDAGRISRIEVIDVPTSGSKQDKDIEIRGRAFRDIIREWKPDYLYFENIHAFKGQGLHAAGVMMHAAGLLEGICICEVDRCVFVTPVKWKGRFDLLHTTKTDARQLVMKMHPRFAEHFDKSMNHNRADACLIATYGADRCDAISLPKSTGFLTMIPKF